MKKILLILGILSVLLLSACVKTSDGTAKDTIYQVQKEGLIWKTYDVWLTNDHPTESNSAIYCPETDDYKTIETLKQAVATKQKCELKYHDEFIVAPWRCNSHTIIDNVECEN